VKPVGIRVMQLAVAGVVLLLLALSLAIMPTPSDQPELIAAAMRAQQLAAAAADTGAARGIGARGRLEPAGGLISVGPGALTGVASASVARLLVKAGDTVAAGQVVAVLDCQERFAAQVVQAEQQVALAAEQLRLAQINHGPVGLAATQATVAQLQHDAEYAASEYARQQELRRIGYSADADVDAARARADNAAAALDRARATLNQQTAGTGSEAKQATANLARARATLDQAREDLRASEVTAPVAGSVIDVLAKPGEQIGPRGIILLGNLSSMEAVAEVAESEVRLLRTGQAATITSAALPAPLTGAIVAIGQQVSRPDALAQQAAAPVDYRIVEVRVRLDDSATAANYSNLVVDINFQP